jgi:hypothetical protein
MESNLLNFFLDIDVDLNEFGSSSSSPFIFLNAAVPPLAALAKNGISRMATISHMSMHSPSPLPPAKSRKMTF